MSHSQKRSTAEVMDVVGSAVSHTELAEPILRDVIGRLTYLTLYLRRSQDLPKVPEAHWESLSRPLTSVPAQAPSLPAGSYAADWFQLASLAEMHGYAPLARLLLDGISARCHNDQEVLALCDSQRGRIARTQGNLAEAILHYKDAIRRSQSTRTSDAWTRANCGLANVLVDLGNFPSAERCYRKALRKGNSVARGTRVYAWMGLAMVRRKRGDLIDAMLCAWNAFDLTDDHSPLRADLLVTLAECALELEHYSAAQVGFYQAIARSPAPRIQVAARTGVVLCQTRQLRQAIGAVQPHQSSLENLAGELRSSVQRLQETFEASSPQQHTLALLTCADACNVLEQVTREASNTCREEWLITARSLIETFDYNEYRFLEEAISNRRPAESAHPTEMPNTLAPSASKVHSRRTDGLVRLAALSVGERTAFVAR